VVLTFNYSDCPVLCSTQLEFLSQALARVPETSGALSLRPGRQFLIVTIALDPAQTADQSRHMRDTYVRRFPADDAAHVRAGWIFLTGPEQSVRMTADAVGLSYRYLPGRDEYVHPALVTFLATDGRVIRYVKGVDYDPLVLSESIWAAGIGSPRDSVGFILTCFHYDPEASSNTGTARKAMKYGAAGFVVLLMLGFAAWHHARTRRGRKES
jgi:protein SCO1/2